MSLAVILQYLYIGFFAFILYYGVAWLYVTLGKYVLDYVFVWAFSPYVFLNWRYLKNNAELSATQDNIAIILCNNYMPEKILSYREDIPRLVKYFRKNNWSYKIYFKADKKIIRDVINDPKATIIYILGHGQRHGVKVGPNEVVYYCDFNQSPKKKFIAQLHCNHNGGLSLADYASQNSINSFVTNKKITSIGVGNFIKKVTKGGVHGAP